MILIKNAKIVENENIVQKNVLIKDNIIEKIGENLDFDCKVIDAKGKYLLPSIIDLNVRLLNNVLKKKNLNKLAKSAKKGGVSTVAVTSNFTPRLDSSTLLDFIKSDIQNLIWTLR